MEKVHENVSERVFEAENEQRKRVDLVRSRLDLLAGKDKVLMEMYWEHGHGFREIARVAGINEASMARRIRRLTKRLINGEYIICLRNRSKFSEAEMAIAKDYFLLGLSMKKVAGKQGWSYYRVRQTLQQIRGVVRTMNNGE